MKGKSWDTLLLGCFSSSPNLPALAGSGSVHEAFEGITKEMIMYDSELEDFSELPEIITIFRGTDSNEDLPRISWSLLEERAKWFYNGKMFKAEIPKDSILAFFSQNTDEKEVLVFLDTGYSVIY